jgi:hypothetical protein
MPGMIYTQKLFINPKFRSSKKLGINPPFTYIVSTNSIDIGFENTKFLRLKTKDINAVTESCKAVPTTVLRTEI